LEQKKGGAYGSGKMETKVGDHPVETIPGVGRMGTSL
jgi:hypothetical protein